MLVTSFTATTAFAGAEATVAYAPVVNDEPSTPAAEPIATPGIASPLMKVEIESAMVVRRSALCKQPTTVLTCTCS